MANTGSLFRTRGAQKYQCFEVLASFLQRYCITALTISIPDCVYFPSYSAKCFSCFMLRRLMMPIYLVKILNIWKVKIWLPGEWKEFWKRVFEVLVSKVLSFIHTKQTSKNVADKTFKIHQKNKVGVIFGENLGKIRSHIVKKQKSWYCQ